MHSAPAVSYPVGRSRFQGSLVGLAGLAGTVTGLFWYRQADPVGWRQALFAMTLLAVCSVAVQSWRRSPQGYLGWDGQAWSWTRADGSVCGLVKVHLDLQFCLVLSLRTDSGSRLWIWPERRAELALWHALRCAVFSRGGAGQARDASSNADWVHR